MTTYRVKPKGNQWVVTRGRTAASNHRKKARAKAKARSWASSGDTIVIHRADGTIQKQVTVR